MTVSRVPARKLRSAWIRFRRTILRAFGWAQWHGSWLRARLRRRLVPGATVVIVNYNGMGLLPATLRAIRRYSPEDLRILVVDNASTDGSREWLVAREDVTTLLQKRNLGHAEALDRGFHQVTTHYAIALDSDAFPIARTWLDALLQPLAEGMTVCGAHAYREFAHPCALAMRTTDFVTRRFSFRARRDARGLDGNFDVGEAISADLPGGVALIPMTSKGETGIGQVYGDVIFHNFYGTRAGIEADELDPGIERPSVTTTWRMAVERYLGED